MSSIGTEREERIRWWHRLPRGRPVERHEALIEAARGRRVVHVGFVDELMASKIAQEVWLHARLAAVASSLVGLDSSEEGVAAARAEGYEAYVVDAQSAEAVRALRLAPADVVIAGEIIEHLDAPGPFLRAMHEAAPRLVLTTPNAYRLLNFLAPISGSELIHRTTPPGRARARSAPCSSARAGRSSGSPTTTTRPAARPPVQPVSAPSRTPRTRCGSCLRR